MSGAADGEPTRAYEAHRPADSGGNGGRDAAFRKPMPFRALAADWEAGVAPYKATASVAVLGGQPGRIRTPACTGSDRARGGHGAPEAS